MTIKRVEAWQTSTGNAYVVKSQACHEEMSWLIRTKGDALRPTIDEANFDNCIKSQKQLITELQSIVPILDTKKDKAVLEELSTLVGRAETWLKDATRLKDDMKTAD